MLLRRKLCERGRIWKREENETKERGEEARERPTFLSTLM
jgi:hypothetical protein